MGKSVHVHKEPTFPVKDDPCSAASQGLMGSCGNDIAAIKRGWNHTGCDEATNVGHIGQQVSPILICYLPQATVIQVTGVATDTYESRTHKKVSVLGQ